MPRHRQRSRGGARLRAGEVVPLLRMRTRGAACHGAVRPAIYGPSAAAWPPGRPIAQRRGRGAASRSAARPRGRAGVGVPEHPRASPSTGAPHGGLGAPAAAPARPAAHPAVLLRHRSGLLLTIRDRPAGGEVAGDPAAVGGEVRAASSSSFSSSWKRPPCPVCLLGDRRVEGPPFPSAEREGGLSEGGVRVFPVGGCVKALLRCEAELLSALGKRCGQCWQGSPTL